jgi:hypothetical protein
MSLVKVKDYEHLRKDLNTGAVVNVDENAYKSFKNAKQKALEQARKIEQQERRINNIEKDVRDIKDLLLQIASKINAS